MINNFEKIFNMAFGLQDIVDATLAMCLRGLIIYIFGILLIRFNKKFIVIRTPLNFIIIIMLGSIAASAITTNTLLIPILCTVMFLVFINKFSSMLEFYFPSIERLFKGSSILLVQHGKINWEMMKKNYITKEELLNELQSQLHTNNLADIQSAILTSERIHFIKK